MVSSGMGELSSVSPDAPRALREPALTASELVALVQSFARDVAAGTHTARGMALVRVPRVEGRR